MGIAEAIARVKEGARRAGLEAVLRGGKLPPPLRPAAQRLADLLKIEEPAAQIVSLNDAIANHEAQERHVGVSHEEMSRAGGVCPFSGMDPNLAALFDLPGLGGADAPDAVTRSVDAASSLPEPQEDGGEFVAGQPVQAASMPEPEVANSLPSAKRKPAAKASSTRAPAARTKPANNEKKAAEKPSEKRPAKAAGKPVATAAALPAQKKAQAKAEKVVEKLAATPSSSKTPARSTVAASARPAAKRPNVKAAKK